MNRNAAVMLMYSTKHVWSIAATTTKEKKKKRNIYLYIYIYTFEAPPMRVRVRNQAHMISPLKE